MILATNVLIPDLRALSGGSWSLFDPQPPTLADGTGSYVVLGLADQKIVVGICYADGSTGPVWFYLYTPGLGWVQVGEPVEASLPVDMSGPIDDLWAVCRSAARALHYTGGAWIAGTPSEGFGFRAVHRRSASDLWAISAGYAIWRKTAGGIDENWSNLYLDAMIALSLDPGSLGAPISLFGRGDGLIYIGTDAGRLVVTDGVDWWSQYLGPQINGIWGTPEVTGDLWIILGTGVHRGLCSGAGTPTAPWFYEAPAHSLPYEFVILFGTGPQIIGDPDGQTIVVACNADGVGILASSEDGGTTWIDTENGTGYSGLGYVEEVSTPPVISNENPPGGLTMVTQYAWIWCDVIAGDSAVDPTKTVITVNGVVAWTAGAPANGLLGYTVPIPGGLRHYVFRADAWPVDMTIHAFAEDLDGDTAEKTWSFTCVATRPAGVGGGAEGSAAAQVRVPIGGLYTDELRDTAVVETPLVINTIPEDGETGVPVDDKVRLHVVDTGAGPLPETVKVYITRSSDGAKRLAYDQTAGGFQTGFQGPDSLATYQASPGSGTNDELLLVIDHEDDWTSQEIITVEVEGGGLA